MMNFDRYNSANQHTGLINESIKSIQLENERLQILRNQKGNRKFLIFFDNEIRDHKMLLSYYQKSVCQKLVGLDPYTHFDLHYNYARKVLALNDLNVLHHFIDHHLFTNRNSTDTPEEKECDNGQKVELALNKALIEQN